MKPYCWVDDHPLLYGSSGSLEPSTYTSFYVKTHESSWNRAP